MCRVPSAAQSTIGIDAEEDDGEKAAMVGIEFSATKQTGEVLLIQNTSRQQAVTPRFGGKFVKVEDEGTLRERLAAVLG